MPTVYTIGIDAAGRSHVAHKRDITMENGVYEVLRIEEPIVPITASSPDVPLLAAMTAEGGAYYNVFAWAPGAGTELHRTTSIDVDDLASELGL